MVKGINRQVIVVRSPDPSLFEQAIFLLRPDAPESCNVTQDELLRQAQAAAKGYSTAHIPGARLRSRLLGRLFWALAGGGAVGLVWLVATFVFFVLAVAFPDLPRKWLVFIYGCPVSFIVTTAFSCLWWRTASRIISITGMIWTLAASVDITLKIPNMFLIYAVAAVLQILVFLWFWLISDRHRAGK